MRSFVTALVVISALLPSSVRGQERCGHPDPEISISVCSAVIQSGRARGRDLAVAHTERGIAYVALLDYDRALHDFGEAIRADATFSKAFANRGAVYGAKQDFDKAIDDFTRVLALEPRSANAFADRASMHRLNGQHDEAIRDYSEAIRLNPAFAEAILNRGITLAGTSRCAEAIADFTRAIELSEPGIGTRTRTGTGTGTRNRYRPGRSRSLPGESGPRRSCGARLLRAPRARAALAGTVSSFEARCTSVRRQYDRALADFAQALIVNPSSPTALYGRGLVKKMTGDTRGGDDDVETAKAMRSRVVEQMAERGVKP